MGAKKIGIAGLVVLGISLGIYFLKRGEVSDNTLHIYTWSNYFPEGVIQDFTKRTGIKIEFSYMSSNEELMAKLRAGATGYDLIQPSDYMVRKMIALSMLLPLEHSQLTNLSNLDATYASPPYDPGQRYAVPFTWGTTGIAINTAKITIPEEGVGWKMLVDSPDPKHTSVLDDMREVFALVLKFKGQSINATEPDVLETAKGDIAGLKSKILLFAAEPKPLLQKEEISIAHIYSCDGAQAQKENSKIRYFIPKEGGTLWTDNLAIPSSTRKRKEAHTFINYILEPDVAVSIVREKSLATPNRVARLKLSPEEQQDPVIYPPKEILEKMQYLEEIGPTLDVVSRMWTELKS